jgi:hypothetical protein
VVKGQMNAIAVTILSIFGLWPHNETQTMRYSDHGWRAEVKTDRFTNSTTCRLKRGSISVQDGMVVFGLGDKANTARAVYRLDSGQAHSVHTISSDAVTDGRPIALVHLDNPSGGKVFMPFSILETTNKVYIRASADEQPRAFDIRGLGQAAAALIAKTSCDPLNIVK